MPSACYPPEEEAGTDRQNCPLLWKPFLIMTMCLKLRQWWLGCNVPTLWQRMSPFGVHTSTEQPAPVDTGSEACRLWASCLILMGPVFTFLSDPLHDSVELQSYVCVSSATFTVAARLEHLVSPTCQLTVCPMPFLTGSLKTGFCTTCLVVKQVKHWGQSQSTGTLH